MGQLSRFFDAMNEIDRYPSSAKNMQLPPEIFTIVCEYLSLHDISSLILINHEVNRWIDMNDIIREYHLVKDSNDIVIASCKYGYINLLMYLHRIKTCIPDDAIRLASYHGHLSVVKYLCSVGVDPMTENNYAIRWASYGGHLSIVEYLYTIGADPTADDNRPIRWASENGHLSVVKYLHSIGANATANDNCAICLASRGGYLSVVKYLHSVGADAAADDNYPIRAATLHGHISVVEYLFDNAATL